MKFCFVLRIFAVRLKRRTFTLKLSIISRVIRPAEKMVKFVIFTKILAELYDQAQVLLQRSRTKGKLVF